MKHTIIAAALLALSFSAAAENNPRPRPPGIPKPIVVEVPAPPMQQQQGQIQGQQQNQHTSVRTGNTSLKAETTLSVTSVQQAQERDPVSTATAPALATSNGTCMGSTSGGAQGASFGFSVGGTWVDAGCDARYDAQALAALGLKAAAVARLCAKPELRDAIERTGQTCFDKPQPTAIKADEPTDPYVRRRLRLAPL